MPFNSLQTPFKNLENLKRRGLYTSTTKNAYRGF
nr:MAG TPA: hypothetical protein [Caudoviricetes sp.]